MMTSGEHVSAPGLAARPDNRVPDARNYRVPEGKQVVVWGLPGSKSLHSDGTEPCLGRRLQTRSGVEFHEYTDEIKCGKYMRASMFGDA